MRRTAYAIAAALVALLIGDSAQAGSIRDWPCPKTIEGKWYPYSRHTIDIIGLMDVGADFVWFSQHGRISTQEKAEINGKKYWELLKPFAGKGESDTYKYRYMTYYLPHELEPIGPEEKCLAKIVLCDTEDDMKKHLTGDRNNYCEKDTYLPLAHTVELIGINEYDLGFENFNKAPD